eukprot:XP_001709426.1 Hypothetical protein GL50803_19208 [Giardia lamblia ATCC 50803]
MIATSLIQKPSPMKRSTNFTSSFFCRPLWRGSSSAAAAIRLMKFGIASPDLPCFLDGYFAHSSASQTPCSPTANVASASGNDGESYILATRLFPRPLRRYKRVVLAWARM